jgi:hypothetical protein
VYTQGVPEELQAFDFITLFFGIQRGSRSRYSKAWSFRYGEGVLMYETRSDTYVCHQVVRMILKTSGLKMADLQRAAQFALHESSKIPTRKTNDASYLNMIRPEIDGRSSCGPNRIDAMYQVAFENLAEKFVRNFGYDGLEKYTLWSFENCDKVHDRIHEIIISTLNDVR